MRVNWGNPADRMYEQGLDRGVLYMTDKTVPWNGLVSFDEGEGGTSAVYYRDGVIFLGDVDASDFKGQLVTLFWPDEFGECLGIPQVTDGFFIDNQKPKRFSFSYRTLVGSGAKGDMFGHQIHLVYNCMASVGTRSRRTLSKDGTPSEFNFELVCTPVKLPGFRPTAHYIIDTRFLSPTTVSDLEDLLYGTDATEGELPDPVVIFDMLNFGDAMTFTVHTDGTYTVVGSNDNLYALNDNHFQMKNVNGTDEGDGTYVISDGGDTDVIIE